jgi:hypothetical protein
MRYRALTPTGDNSFGRGQDNFLTNTPAAVGQAVVTRLKLLVGEWFLDVTEGTPYSTNVLGAGTVGEYDLAIQERVLGTQGVLSILLYESVLDKNTRELTVNITVDTVYGQTTISQVL